jgi:hypothetical protein
VITANLLSACTPASCSLLPHAHIPHCQHADFIAVSV